MLHRIQEQLSEVYQNNQMVFYTVLIFAVYINLDFARNQILIRVEIRMCFFHLLDLPHAYQGTLDLMIACQPANEKAKRKEK